MRIEESTEGLERVKSIFDDFCEEVVLRLAEIAKLTHDDTDLTAKGILDLSEKIRIKTETLYSDVTRTVGTKIKAIREYNALSFNTRHN